MFVKVRKAISIMVGMYALSAMIGAQFTADALTPPQTGVYMFGRTTSNTYASDNCTDSSGGCTAPGRPSTAFSGFGAFANSPVTFQEEPAVENFFLNSSDTISSIMVVGRGADNNLYYSSGGGGTGPGGVPARNFTPFASLDNGQGISFQGKPALARVCGANASACKALFVIGRGNQGGILNDYWYRIFSTSDTRWDTPWIRLGAFCKDDPVAVAPNFTNTFNLLFLYCRGGDNSLYARSIVLQRPFDGNNSVPKPAETVIAASAQWEGMPDSSGMVITPVSTHVRTTGGGDQVWGFIRGGNDNAVYYTVMNTPPSPTCAPPGPGQNIICAAPTRFTYDARGNFTGVGGQLSYQQNPSGSFYTGAPMAVSPNSRPGVGWLRPDGMGFLGSLMVVGLGGDTSYVYTVFDQARGQWTQARGIPNGSGFQSDPEVNDANHFSIRLMGRSGATLLYNYYDRASDRWASDGINQPYFNVGTGFVSKPVLFNND